MKRLTMVSLLLLSLTAITACGSDDTATSSVAEPAARSGPNVVASTAWTGALAQAAGAAKVTLIAPANNSHPSDAEPKPSDLSAVTGADYVVLAEYDGFAKALRDATGSSAKVIGLTPENSPAKVRADVLALGKTFKTPERAQAWIATFDAEYRKLSDHTKAVAAGKTAVAHMFMAPWATFSGTKLVGTYGPGPMKPSQLLKLKRKNADLLLENAHLPFGGGLAGDHTRKATLVNYPRSLDLLTVFRENAAAIQAAAR